MKLFYHHVGQEGSDKDFPKTVHTRLPLSSIEDSLTDAGDPSSLNMIPTLRTEFPSGWLNCWGVPPGASRVIGSMNSGDVVLLLESTSGQGPMPVLAEVKAYWHTELPSLSRFLWNDNRFAFIFFFETEYVDLDWQTFISHVGYAPNFDPRGQFHSVADSRLTDWDGPAGYVAYLRSDFSTASHLPELEMEQIIREVPSADQKYLVSTEEETSNLLQQAMDVPPKLTSEGEANAVTQEITPRDASFRSTVKQIYGFRCAVCQRSRRSPSGTLEVESAHIYPKQYNGSDDLRNGICLCRLHHWAFDVGWFSLRDDLTIVVKHGLPNHPDYDFIRDYADRKISVPNDLRLVPHSIFLRAHRQLHSLD